MEPVLDVRDVAKRYGGVQALAGVDLQLRAGQVHGLVGANGAGKSTLVKAVSGLVSPDAGTITVAGKPVNPGRHPDGVGLVPQHSQLCATMTVEENVLLGRYPTRPFGRLLDRGKVRSETANLLEELEIDVSPKACIADLTVAERRMVEVAKAVAHAATLLILDEPTATLGPSETHVLLELIERLGQRGVAVVLVTHRLAEVVAACDSATVMRNGNVVATFDQSGFDVDDLVEPMIGRELQLQDRGSDVRLGDCLVDVAAATSAKLRAVDLKAREGELVMITGLVGSGRSSLLGAVFGRHRLTAGRIKVQGQTVDPPRPDRAVASGLRYVPEQREQGLCADLSVMENLTLPLVANGALTRFGFIRRRQRRKVAQDLVHRFGIKVDSVDDPVSSLSGGNQQKVMLAASFSTDPDVLLVDEPTQGVDVGAKAEVHQLLLDFRGNGGSVVAVSSETDECLALGDRFVVMHQGEAVGGLPRSGCSEARLTELSFGRTEQNGATNE